MDAAQWLADYDRKLADTERTTAEATTRLQSVAGHAVSPRGEAEVTVGAGGALQALTLSPTARALEVDDLARLIVETAKRAQADAGTQVAGVVADLYGADAAPLESLASPAAADAEPEPRRAGSDDDYFEAPEVRA